MLHHAPSSKNTVTDSNTLSLTTLKLEQKSKINLMRVFAILLIVTSTVSSVNPLGSRLFTNFFLSKESSLGSRLNAPPVSAPIREFFNHVPPLAIPILLAIKSKTLALSLTTFTTNVSLQRKVLFAVATIAITSAALERGVQAYESKHNINAKNLSPPLKSVVGKGTVLINGFDVESNICRNLAERLGKHGMPQVLVDTRAANGTDTSSELRNFALKLAKTYRIRVKAISVSEPLGSLTFTNFAARRFTDVVAVWDTTLLHPTCAFESSTNPTPTTNPTSRAADSISLATEFLNRFAAKKAVGGRFVFVTIAHKEAETHIDVVRATSQGAITSFVDSVVDELRHKNVGFAYVQACDVLEEVDSQLRGTKQQTASREMAWFSIIPTGFVVAGDFIKQQHWRRGNSKNQITERKSGINWGEGEGENMEQYGNKEVK